MKSIFTLPAILLFICATLAIDSCSNPNELPAATFIKPRMNSSYFEGETMDIEISAWDTDGTIAQVEILLNGASIAILNSEPYKFSYEIKNIKPGYHNFEAIVTDDQGDQGSGGRQIKILLVQEFTDTRDGNTYRYVIIGNQTWMADNLAFLPEVYPSSEGSDSLPRYYVYDYQGNDVTTAKQTEHYSKYGVLYNWEAAMQAAPEGWHLPSIDDWNEVDDYIQGKPMCSILTHTSEGGCNQYGFSGIYAGVSGFGGWAYNGFTNLGDVAAWWSSSLGDGIYPFGMGIFRTHILLSVKNLYSAHGYSGFASLPNTGHSVRCIKDDY